MASGVEALTLTSESVYVVQLHTHELLKLAQSPRVSRETSGGSPQILPFTYERNLQRMLAFIVLDFFQLVELSMIFQRAQINVRLVPSAVEASYTPTQIQFIEQTSRRQQGYTAGC